MLKFFLTVLLFSYLQGEGTIRGQIIDAINQLPLSLANIKVENSDAGTSSDVNGEFVLDFSKEGY